MNWETLDLTALERLRAAFLSGTAGERDYWRSESDLASYDATFAQRIGWKWDYVLAELQRRGWSPTPGPLLDWGCGSGIAHRAFLDFFGTTSISELRLMDRSPLAVQFATNKARMKYPGLNITPHSLADGTPLPPGTTLLISHVLTELQPAQTEALAEWAATASTVIWVEPGTYEASLTLIAVRERLRERLNVIAPCTHAGRCGILAPQNERHWCHHFASPPPAVFTDSDWGKFAQLAGIDLRDLPLSFLVLDRRAAPALPLGTTRVIGHPRLYKPYALMLGCDKTGVSEKRLTKREHPAQWRELKHGECDPLQIWRTDGEEIMETKPLPSVA